MGYHSHKNERCPMVVIRVVSIGSVVRFRNTRVIQICPRYEAIRSGVRGYEGIRSGVRWFRCIVLDVNYGYMKLYE